MGAEPYWYIVKYEKDVNQALQNLRQREFLAGRYNPVMSELEFPITEESPSPGPQHSSIEEVWEVAGADGTRSILDIQKIADDPDFCTAILLEDERLEEIYGTSQPTKEMVQLNQGFFDEIERGHGVFFTIYEDGKPNYLLFAGYSFD